MSKRCDFCGYHAPIVFVHGHYQCAKCHQVSVTCCEGSSNCEVQIFEGKKTQNSMTPIDNDTVSQTAIKKERTEHSRPKSTESTMY